jgi:hypothetical protein
MRFMMLMIPKGYEKAAPGVWMIQVKSKEEAIEWASRCPASENEVIEIRQVQEFSDFPADVQEVVGKFPELQGQPAQHSRP